MNFIHDRVIMEELDIIHGNTTLKTSNNSITIIKVSLLLTLKKKKKKEKKRFEYTLIDIWTSINCTMLNIFTWYLNIRKYRDNHILKTTIQLPTIQSLITTKYQTDTTCMNLILITQQQTPTPIMVYKFPIRIIRFNMNKYSF